MATAERVPGIELLPTGEDAIEGEENTHRRPPPDSRSTPLGGGAGFSFPTWNPPDFNREMERAERVIGEANQRFEERKNTDLGLGVICNTDGRWFFCEHDDIARCNREHDDLCHFADEKERRELTEDRFF